VARRTPPRTNAQVAKELACAFTCSCSVGSSAPCRSMARTTSAAHPPPTYTAIANHDNATHTQADTKRRAIGCGLFRPSDEVLSGSSYVGRETVCSKGHAGRAFRRGAATHRGSRELVKVGAACERQVSEAAQAHLHHRRLARPAWEKQLAFLWPGSKNKSKAS
jgi:hypothetical protein